MGERAWLSVVVVIFLIALAHSPPARAFHLYPENTVLMEFESATPAGILVYKVTNPAGLGVYGQFKHSADALTPFAPRYMGFVHPNGKIETLNPYNWGYFTPGSKNYLETEGGIYAGTENSTLKSPKLDEFKFTNHDVVYEQFNATEGFFVTTWAFFDDEFHFWFKANWTAGTNFELVYAGTDIVAANEMDFHSGVRAGVSPVAVAHVGDRLEASGEQILGLVAWSRPGAAGVGEISIGDPLREHSYSLTASNEEDVHDRASESLRYGVTIEYSDDEAAIVGRNESRFSVSEIERDTNVPATRAVENLSGMSLASDGRGCGVCPERNTVILSTAGSAWVDLTYAGYSRQMEVGVLFAKLPAGLLPSDVYVHRCWIKMPNDIDLQCDPPGRF